MNIGFTIGKFAPFHKGHQFLIKTALQDMDQFYVIVYDTPELNIDIETKIKWIKEEFPNIDIIKAFDSPKQFGLDTESVKIQMDYLSNLIGYIPVTHFYSSEDYGKCIAESLNIKNVLVDKERIKYQISARMIRKDLDKYIEFINYNVYKTIKE